MSDNGLIVCGVSEDFSGDIDEICELLNNSGIASAVGEFTASGDTFEFDVESLDESFSAPIQQKNTVSIEVNGELTNVAVTDELIDSWDGDLSDFFEEVELSVFAREICEFIESGQISFSYSLIDEDSVYFESYTISSDGSAHHVVMEHSNGELLNTDVESC